MGQLYGEDRAPLGPNQQNRLAEVVIGVVMTFAVMRWRDVDPAAIAIVAGWLVALSAAGMWAFQVFS
jgi:hypothetical protein